MRRAFAIGLVLLAATQTTWTQQPRTHDLALTPEHVHWGYYDSRVPPADRLWRSRAGRDDGRGRTAAGEVGGSKRV